MPLPLLIPIAGHVARFALGGAAMKAGGKFLAKSTATAAKTTAKVAGGAAAAAAAAGSGGSSQSSPSGSNLGLAGRILPHQNDNSRVAPPAIPSGSVTPIRVMSSVTSKDATSLLQTTVSLLSRIGNVLTQQFQLEVNKARSAREGFLEQRSNGLTEGQPGVAGGRAQASGKPGISPALLASAGGVALLAALGLTGVGKAIGEEAAEAIKTGTDAAVGTAERVGSGVRRGSSRVRDEVATYGANVRGQLGIASQGAGKGYAAATVVPRIVAGDRAFRSEVTRTAKKYNMAEDDLYRIMSFESGGSFDPNKKNAAGSGGTGMIQFMPNYGAKTVGKTTAELGAMSRAEQMKYVDKYFGKMGLGKVKKPSLGDAYMTVYKPVAVGKGDNYVHARKGSIEYAQNSGFDLNENGSFTTAEALTKLRSHQMRGIPTGNLPPVPTAAPGAVPTPGAPAPKFMNSLMYRGGGAAPSKYTMPDFSGHGRRAMTSLQNAGGRINQGARREFRELGAKATAFGQQATSAYDRFRQGAERRLMDTAGINIAEMRYNKEQARIAENARRSKLTRQDIVSQGSNISQALKKDPKNDIIGQFFTRVGKSWTDWRKEQLAEEEKINARMKVVAAERGRRYDERAALEKTKNAGIVKKQVANAATRRRQMLTHDRGRETTRHQRVVPRRDGKGFFVVDDRYTGAERIVSRTLENGKTTYYNRFRKEQDPTYRQPAAQPSMLIVNNKSRNNRSWTGGVPPSSRSTPTQIRALTVGR